MSLLYIAEAYIIAASSGEAREFAATIVRLQTPFDFACGSGGYESRFPAKIQGDLSSLPTTHKLPASLRILHDGESISYTAGGKPIKHGLL